MNTGKSACRVLRELRRDLLVEACAVHIKVWQSRRLDGRAVSVPAPCTHDILMCDDIMCARRICMCISMHMSHVPYRLSIIGRRYHAGGCACGLAVGHTDGQLAFPQPYHGGGTLGRCGAVTAM